MNRISLLTVLLLMLLLAKASSIQACSIIKTTPPEELVAEADIIVRATADSYDKAPEGDVTTTGIPETTVKFKIVETLKGKVSEPLLIYGYLSDKDDYNENPVPYTFIRRGGRRGSCIANKYKEGADFLLFLKKRGDKLTPYWRSLMPVNEQLRSSDDEWLLWVKKQLKTTLEKEEQSNLNAFLFTGYSLFFKFAD